MNNRLQQICEVFVDNGRVIRENFVWNDTYLYPLISMMYTLNNRKVNTIDLRDCKGLIIKESTMLAGIRGMSNMAWTARLAQYEHPRTSIDQIHDIYGMLREEFKTCQNLANVAFQLFELCDRDCYENVIQRTQNIYKMTKQSHPMLNSNDHLSYIVLLALSDKEEEKIVEEIEQCLALLMEQYSYTNGVQALSLVLALGQESCESRVWKSIAIYEELLHRRLKIGKGLELASIGVATLFFNKELEEEIEKAYHYISSSKEFGSLSMTNRNRVMYAIIFVCERYIKDLMDQYQGDVVKVPRIYRIAEHMAINTAMLATT